MYKNNFQKGTVYSGWSEVNITPKKPVRLGGQFKERISKYVQSPIISTILAVETKNYEGDSIEQIIFISCDLSFITKDIINKVRKKIDYSLKDFDSKKLIINATHNHTAPLLSNSQTPYTDYIKYIPKHIRPNIIEKNISFMSPCEYVEFLIEKLFEGCKKAWESREISSFSNELSHVVVGHSRRVIYTNGSAKMYGETNTASFDCLEGSVDHGVELLYFFNSSNKLIGIVINIACPAQVLEKKCFISSDYWGEVRKKLKKRYGKDLYVLALLGAAGDQSPRDLVRRGRKESDMYDLSGAKDIGLRIANGVDEKYKEAIKNKNKKVIFQHKVLKLDFPIRRATKDEYEIAKKQFYSYIDSKNDERLNYEDLQKLHLDGAIIDRYEKQKKKGFLEQEIHIIRLGDVAIATNPFELFTDYGLQIKARSKAIQTFIIQHACDKGKYLPTKLAIKGGHYSAIIASNKVGIKAGKMLVEKTVEKINEMY